MDSSHLKSSLIVLVVLFFAGCVFVLIRKPSISVARRRFCAFFGVGVLLSSAMLYLNGKDAEMPPFQNEVFFVASLIFLIPIFTPKKKEKS